MYFFNRLWRARTFYSAKPYAEDITVYYYWNSLKAKNEKAGSKCMK